MKNFLLSNTKSIFFIVFEKGIDDIPDRHYLRIETFTKLIKTSGGVSEMNAFESWPFSS